MKIYKKILGFFALAVLLNPNTLTLDASTFSKKDQIQNKEILYDITAFTTEKNTLNLIINQLFKEDNTLFIDAYFLNTTENTTFENLENFNISVCDTNNKEVLNKTFKSVVIPKGLPPQHGRRILFPIENEFFNLQEKDLSKLSYKFTFDYN
ncbi:hypothetical protein ACV3U9_01995 [Clostridium perfringens]|uniref:DUF4352 domain-containing protein n=1 Tax=Clostridium perfringens TaxID=1502 RepID=A0AAW9IHB7_CLOPF|nr:hypothetical protein [Clostridium perfringens]ELC8432286.1 hypothetical protein [Clostridium perfringens]MBI5995914.1 hypothetical protein [Clostridium perfringens]MBI6011497.1 hypothetical protein [Clostridium perfringens]MBI6027797.1 hypothetical protein [Clostridium perfringens]MBI6071330.1 hypothetical protein [Clostridium perfringens]